ncbi:MAG: hypothetical protein ACKVJN_18490, partial [Woeseiales bacterium]
VLGAYAHQVEIGAGALIAALLRVLGIVFVINQDYGLIGVLMVISSVEIAMMLSYLIRVGFVVRSRTKRVNHSSSRSLARRALRFSAPNALMSALGFFEGRFGMVFVISSSMGTAAVGNYSFVFVVLQFGSIVNPIYTLNTLIDNVIVRSAVHTDQRTLLARGQGFFLALTAYTAVPVAVYALLLSAPLSQVFGFEHAGTGWLFLWAGVFFIANSIKLAYGNIFSQLEVPYYRLLFGIIGIIGVGAAFLVIDQHGIVGVAAVAGISSFVGLVVQHLVSRMILDIPVGIYPAVLLKILAINTLAGAATATVISVSDRFVVLALVSFVVFVTVYGGFAPPFLP